MTLTTKTHPMILTFPWTTLTLLTLMSHQTMMILTTTTKTDQASHSGDLEMIGPKVVSDPVEPPSGEVEEVEP